jgi:hypothetical protein
MWRSTSYHSPSGVGKCIGAVGFCHGDVSTKIVFLRNCLKVAKAAFQVARSLPFASKSAFRDEGSRGIN